MWTFTLLIDIMANRYKECKPTMIHRKELISDDGIYMDREIIKEKCLCKFKSTCIELIWALERNDTKMVDQLFDVLNGNQI